MIPFQIIQLTDGTTTITLNDGASAGRTLAKKAISYTVDAYAPRVPARRTSVLGGRGPMQDVSESMTVTVWGDTAQNAVDNLYRLWGLLDQARRFMRNERVNPVRLRLQVQGGRKGVLECLVLGAAGSETTVDIAPEYLSDFGRYCIGTVQISFTRRGQLLRVDAAGSISIAPGAAVTGTVQTFAWPTVDAQQTADPLVATITGINPTGGDAGFTAALLITDGNALDRINASGCAGIGGFTAVTDTATALSYGAQILRYTSAAPGVNSSGTAAATNTAYSRRIAIYATVRSSSSSASWDITVSFRTPFGSSVRPDVETAPKTFVGLAGFPVPICLGVAAFQGDLTQSTPGFDGLFLSVSTQSTGVSLDFDQIYLVALDTPSGNDIVIPGVTIDGDTSAYTIVLDPCQLTRPQPHVLYQRVGPPLLRDYIGYRGNLWSVAGSPTLSAVLIVTSGAAWTYTNNGSTKALLTTTLTRQLAYSTPQ